MQTTIDYEIEQLSAPETRAILGCLGAFLRGDVAGARKHRADFKRAKAARVIDVEPLPQFDHDQATDRTLDFDR